MIVDSFGQRASEVKACLLYGGDNPIDGIVLELRRLHRELDGVICNAYGWSDLDLGHDFHEVETLAENDRVRDTISPAARKEALRRLLALNNQPAAPKKSSKGRRGTTAKPKSSDDQDKLF